MLNLRLVTPNGDAFVTAEEICLVSSVYKKPGRPESRAVGLKSGHTVYILNSAANIKALRDSGQGAAIPAAESPRKKDKLAKPKPPKPGGQANAQEQPDDDDQ